MHYYTIQLSTKKKIWTRQNIAKLWKHLHRVGNPVCLILCDNAVNAIKSIKDLNELMHRKEQDLFRLESDCDESNDTESECNGEPEDKSEEESEIMEMIDDRETSNYEFALIVNHLQSTKKHVGSGVVHSSSGPSACLFYFNFDSLIKITLTF